MTRPPALRSSRRTRWCLSHPTSSHCTSMSPANYPTDVGEWDDHARGLRGSDCEGARSQWHLHSQGVDGRRPFPRHLRAQLPAIQAIDFLLINYTPSPSLLSFTLFHGAVGISSLKYALSNRVPLATATTTLSFCFRYPTFLVELEAQVRDLHLVASLLVVHNQFQNQILLTLWNLLQSARFSG